MDSGAQRFLRVAVVRAAASVPPRPKAAIKRLIPHRLRSSVLGAREWSIGVAIGSSPFALEVAGAELNPVLTPADVTDTEANCVADPFVVRHTDGWWMFFEYVDVGLDRGMIGLAHSTDALHWRYQGTVLREPFHLSYPYVFEHEGAFYMVPESAQAGEVRLYRADPFPTRWRCIAVLLKGTYLDSSLVRHGQRWWMHTHQRAADGTRTLRLYGADALSGPWSEHARSPIVAGDTHIDRPGGRVLALDGCLYRFAQDGARYYGEAVRALRIDTLTATEYREHEIDASPVLRPGSGLWNAVAVHHLDPHEIEPGRWVGFVDGS